LFVELKTEEAETQKWDIKVFVSKNATVSARKDASNLWKRKDKEGKSDLDRLREIASEGWELVSTTPLTFGAQTEQVLFTFKRPKE
jgi:hypothetical protein